MSLFVRLETGFWTHRKTLRLRVAIGDAAFWVPPRLWSYAAEHQPDGDFTDYSAQELAMLIGYASDAIIMLEALQRVAFMDGMQLHGWEERNGYHKTFSERAKKAANARWSGKEKRVKREENRGEERRGEERSNASSNAQASEPRIRPTIEQAKASAQNSMVSEVEAERWWNAREGSEWLKGTAGGGSLPVGRNWQADMKSFTESMRESARKGENRNNGHKHHRSEADRDRARTGLDSNEVGKHLKRL